MTLRKKREITTNDIRNVYFLLFKFLFECLFDKFCNLFLIKRNFRSYRHLERIRASYRRLACRRLIDIETTSCVYGTDTMYLQTQKMSPKILGYLRDILFFILVRLLTYATFLFYYYFFSLHFSQIGELKV